MNSTLGAHVIYSVRNLDVHCVCTCRREFLMHPAGNKTCFVSRGQNENFLPCRHGIFRELRDRK